MVNVLFGIVLRHVCVCLSVSLCVVYVQWFRYSVCSHMCEESQIHACTEGRGECQVSDLPLETWSQADNQEANCSYCFCSYSTGHMVSYLAFGVRAGDLNSSPQAGAAGVRTH